MGRIKIIRCKNFFLIEIHQYANGNSDGEGDSIGVVEKIEDNWVFTPLEGNRKYKGQVFQEVGQAFKASEEYRTNH